MFSNTTSSDAPAPHIQATHDFRPHGDLTSSGSPIYDIAPIDATTPRVPTTNKKSTEQSQSKLCNQPRNEVKSQHTANNMQPPTKFATTDGKCHAATWHRSPNSNGEEFCGYNTVPPGYDGQESTTVNWFTADDAGTELADQARIPPKKVHSTLYNFKNDTP